VLFLDLRGYTPDPAERVSAAAAAGQLLRAMGIRDHDLPPTGPERLALYQSVLADRARRKAPVLVVADNAAVSGQVEPLLPAQPCHRLLVTSRHSLTLPAHLIDLAVLPEAEALDLLRTALCVGGHDQRLEAEPEHLAEIAGLCGRLPLALRITAALLRTEPGRPLADMAAELGDARRLDALDSDDLDQHGRRIAVRATFDLSYQHLLDSRPDQARLFRLLPLNPGPDISLEAAAALTGTPERVVRKQLAALVRAHLLTTPTYARWSMHDLIRLYAGELGHAQATANDRDQALERLLSHYLSVARAARAHLIALPGHPVPGRFTGRDAAMAWLDAERANLVAAVTFAAGEAGRHESAIELAFCLNEYLEWRRALNDRLTVNTASVTAGVRLGDRRREGGSLNNLGNSLYEMRRFDEAVTVHQAAIAIFRELGDRHGVGTASANLGNALQQVSRFDEAITAHQAAAAIFREVGDLYTLGLVTGNLGTALQEVSRFDEAVTVHQAAITIFRELRDRRGVGAALDNLGNALGQVSRFDEAITAHRSAAAIFQEVGDRRGEGMALNNLGTVLEKLGRFDEAFAAHRQDLLICREIGDRHGEAQTLNNLGSVLRQTRRFDEACTALHDSATIFHELGDHRREVGGLINLGNTLKEAGRSDEAAAVYAKAEDALASMADDIGREPPPAAGPKAGTAG
jgi:tetratricopeptide (TPR) repeat protein